MCVRANIGKMEMIKHVTRSRLCYCGWNPLSVRSSSSLTWSGTFDHPSCFLLLFSPFCRPFFPISKNHTLIFLLRSSSRYLPHSFLVLLLLSVFPVTSLSVHWLLFLLNFPPFLSISTSSSFHCDSVPGSLSDVMSHCCHRSVRSHLYPGGFSSDWDVNLLMVSPAVRPSRLVLTWKDSALFDSTKRCFQLFLRRQNRIKLKR